MNEITERFTQLLESNTWAVEAASYITEQVEPEGKVTYCLPAPRKIRLVCDIAEALIRERTNADRAPWREFAARLVADGPSSERYHISKYAFFVCPKCGNHGPMVEDICTMCGEGSIAGYDPQVDDTPRPSAPSTVVNSTS